METEDLTRGEAGDDTETEAEGVRPPERKKLHGWRFVAIWVLGSVIGMYALSAGSILMLGAKDPPEDIEIVIPAGTEEAMRSGGDPPKIPQDIEFRQGDVLVLVNEDRATHQLGTWQVGPEQTFEVILSEATGGTLACSFHPKGRLDIEVRTGIDLKLAWIPALILGIPLGFALAGAAHVARRLDDGT